MTVKAGWYRANDKEALDAIARWASSLRQSKDGSLEVTDDGRGMPAAPSLGRGLRGIRKRAQSLGGSVSWSAPPKGSGTVFTLDLPLDGAAAG